MRFQKLLGAFIVITAVGILYDKYKDKYDPGEDNPSDIDREYETDQDRIIDREYETDPLQRVIDKVKPKQDHSALGKGKFLTDGYSYSGILDKDGAVRGVVAPKEYNLHGKEVKRNKSTLGEGSVLS